MLELARLKRQAKLVPKPGVVDKLGRRIAKRRGRKVTPSVKMKRLVTIEEAHAIMREHYPKGMPVEELAERIGYRTGTIRRLASELGLKREQWSNGYVP